MTTGSRRDDPEGLHRPEDPGAEGDVSRTEAARRGTADGATVPGPPGRRPPQPLHVGDNHDRGGNDTQVRWFTRGSNMHRVWDSGIIDRAESGRRRLARRPDRHGHATRPARRLRAAPSRIGRLESLLAARQAYQDPATGQRIKPGTKLADSYPARSLPLRNGGSIRWARYRQFGSKGVPCELTTSCQIHCRNICCPIQSHYERRIEATF